MTHVPTTVGGTGFPEPENPTKPEGAAVPPAETVQPDTSREQLVLRIADLQREVGKLLQENALLREKLRSVGDLEAKKRQIDGAYQTTLAAIEFLANQSKKAADHLDQTYVECRDLANDLKGIR